VVGKIKRLLDTSKAGLVYDLMRQQPDAWRDELRWWNDHAGIDVKALLEILHRASIERSLWEMRLKAPDGDDTQQTIGRAKRALRSAAPLIDFLKTEWLAGGRKPYIGLLIGEEIERTVQNYIDHLTANRPRRPAHSPGDPWLKKLVLRLVELLRMREQSVKGSIRAVHRLLKLAGHGDRATAEKIRHFIREERRRILKNRRDRGRNVYRK
jgi:hypothetical protein